MQSLRSISPLTAVFILGFILSVVSLRYIRTVECHYICEGGTCPPTIGSCGLSQPYAGFPLPILQDRAGSSPTTSWGRIDYDNIDDLSTFNPFYFIANTLFYAACFWLPFQFSAVLWSNQNPNTLLKTVPLPIVAIVGVSILVWIQWLTVPNRTMNWVDQQAIQGTWELIEPTTEEDIILYFAPEGKIPDLNGGYYWVASDMIQISVSSMVPGFCANTLFFLRTNCHTDFIDPASYPAPSETIFPVYSYPYPAPDTVVPTPAPTATPDPNAEPLHYSNTHLSFTVRFDGDTMTLTAISIAPLTFRRVQTP